MTRAADLAKLIAGGGSITVSDNSENLKLITTDADASVGPTLRMDRQSASAADSDLLGKINFVGHNDAGTPEDIGYAGITAIISDASDGTEDGKLAINTMVAGTERSRIFVDAGETVFNEDSIDVNFRVETDNSVFGLFVDAGNDHVCINTGTDHGGVLNIETTGNGDTVTLACTDTDASTGPVLVLKRAVTGADDDLLGRIRFDGRDSAGNNTTYARLDTQIKAAADGSESSKFTLKHLKGGSEITAIDSADAEFVINQDSADVNFRVESDGDANMFFVDAGNDRIGIGTNSPSARLQVDDGSGRNLQIAPSGSGIDIISTTNPMRLITSDASNMIFSTNGSSNQRMIIDSSGNILFGATSASAPSMSFQPDSGGGSFQSAKDSTNTRNAMVFINPNGTVGTISISGSATSYNTSSDYRLKENVVTDWDATSRLKQLKPSRFNFKADKDTTVDGFLAHEVSSIVPEAVTGTKDEVDENGDAVMQGIDQSKLVPLLVKTIQELEARIAKLEG